MIMITIKRISFILIMTALVFSCKSRAAFPKLSGEAPRTVAVLPVEGTLQIRARSILRRLVGTFLADKQYYKLDDEYLDGELARAGWRPWDEAWIPSDAELAHFGKKAGADALLILTGFEDDRVSAAVFYKRGLAGTVKWFDVRSGSVIWSAPVSASRSGGVLLESGQIIKAVADTAAASGEEQFIKLAAVVALDIVNDLPAGAATAELRERPNVTEITLVSKADLRAGDTLQIQARGTRRSRGVARVGGTNLQFPLHESAPGVYVGSLRIEPGAGGKAGPVSVVLFDDRGDASEQKLTKESINIVAPRVDPPARVRVDVAAGGNLKYKISWDAVAGAQNYEVVRLGPGGPVSFTIINATTFEDEPPAGVAPASYAVSARTESGILGPPSAAALVAPAK